MFTPEARARLRSGLLEEAARDKRISGAAITGSAALDGEDRWSDIDLAFGVADAADVPSVLSDWTDRMYDAHSAVHHVDVRAGAWIYRVFLLESTLQVDLAFAPATDFRALAPSFRLVFGSANEAQQIPPPVSADLAGMGWLYALHARSSLARGKPWQAEYMIAGLRQHVLSLACVRHGFSADHGRGFDQLPAEVRAEMEASLVRHLHPEELSRAFQAAVTALLREIRRTDGALAARLEETLTAVRDFRAASA